MLPAAVLFVASVALAVALVMSLARGPLLDALGRLAPRPRIRWLFGAIASPLGAGAIALALALGHCVVPLLVGLDDDCRGVTGAGCAFCLLLPASAGAAAWLLSAVVTLPVVRQAVRSGRGAYLARRARARLRTVASMGSDGVWRVPGAGAFVLGWPDAVVCIGEDLARDLGSDAVRAVAAHEDEHRLRGDVWLRGLARLLASAHLPGTGRALLSALDLAIEQTCDERACEAVADPLIVAQALLDVARLQDHDGGMNCVPASLDARVEALCVPTTHTRALPSAVGALVALAAIALLLDHQIHKAAETLIHFVVR